MILDAVYLSTSISNLSELVMRCVILDKTKIEMEYIDVV